MPSKGRKLVNCDVRFHGRAVATYGCMTIGRLTVELMLIAWTLVSVQSASAADEPSHSRPSKVASQASSDASSLVIGFERFGRHDEIDSVTAGQLLISELSCAACHATTKPACFPKRGPRLDAIATRGNERWIRDFLADPQQAKPGTTMPDLLGGFPKSERAAVVEALTAYLMTLQKPYPEVKGSGAIPVPFQFWKHGDRQSGRSLYHSVGCVACHAPDPDYQTTAYEPSPTDRLIEQFDEQELADMGLTAAARSVPEIPLPDVAAKYDANSLTHFLLDPSAVRPGGRMPALKLSPVESADIAAYLINSRVHSSDRLAVQASDESADAQADDSTKSDTVIDDAAELSDTEEIDTIESESLSLVDTGRLLFDSIGCAACHDLGQSKWEPTAFAMSDLRVDVEKSCLTNPALGSPVYALDADQKSAILEAFDQRTSFGPQPQPYPDYRLMQLNCLACHERGELGGVGRHRKAFFETVGGIDLGDEGRLPPPLTDVGGKLTTAWLTKVLAGRGDVRPHMTIRMPVFAAATTTELVNGLAAQDIIEPQSPGAKVFTDTAITAGDGHALMDIGCVQCHMFRGDALPGVVGVDLEGVTQRVRPEWFRKFVLNPGSVKKQTRMPNFFAGGTTQNQSILGGDPESQVEAMWKYLDEMAAQPLPGKIEAVRRTDFEIAPKKRARILRTFMPEAGTHAIAVGFPAGAHFAFDAENLRFAELWNGRFIDAQGTWFIRFAPPASPQGEAVVKLPAGVPFARLVTPQDEWPLTTRDLTGYRFDGYSVDESGVPTFRYHIGEMSVTDRMVAVDEHTFRRTVRLTQSVRPPATSQLYFRVAEGAERSQIETVLVDQRDTSLTSVSASEIGQTFVRHDGTYVQIATPDLTDGTTTIQVIYRW